VISIAQSACPIEKAPLETHPSLESVKKVLCPSAVGNITFSLSGFTASYISRWIPGIVVDIDCQYDEKDVPRVTGLQLRLRSKDDSFLPIKRGK
jgi:hypothetical protein